MTIIKRFSDIQSRLALDLTARITADDLDSLIQRYELLPEEARQLCQVASAKSRCNEKHRNGWLARKKDGKEVLIGTDCGDKYFRANGAFIADSARLDRLNQIADFKERLASYRANSEFGIRLEMAELDITRFRNRRNALLSNIPLSTQRHLTNMSRTRNTTVWVQLKKVEKDEKGDDIVKWEDELLGSLQGVSIWLYEQSKRIDDNIKETRRALDGFAVGKTEDVRLRNQLKALDSFGAIVSSLNELERALDDFMSDANIRLLSFLQRGFDDRVSIAKLFFPNIQSKDLEKVAAWRIRELDEELRRIYGRDFRIP